MNVPRIILSYNVNEIIIMIIINESIYFSSFVTKMEWQNVDAKIRRTFLLAEQILIFIRIYYNHLYCIARNTH